MLQLGSNSTYGYQNDLLVYQLRKQVESSTDIKRETLQRSA
jgi:hypothetical protein